MPKSTRAYETQEKTPKQRKMKKEVEGGGSESSSESSSDEEEVDFVVIQVTPDTQRMVDLFLLRLIWTVKFSSVDSVTIRVVLFWILCYKPYPHAWWLTKQLPGELDGLDIKDMPVVELMIEVLKAGHTVLFPFLHVPVTLYNISFAPPEMHFLLYNNLINRYSVAGRTKKSHACNKLLGCFWFFLDSMSSIHMESYPYDFDPHDASHLKLSIPPTGAWPMDHVGTNAIQYLASGKPFLY